MIPPFEYSREPLKPIAAATDDEVFISQETLTRTLSEQHKKANAMSGLWRSIMRNEGVHLDEDGQVDHIRRGGLYAVRTLGDRPLISVDGLVDGIANGELSTHGVRKLGPKRLGEIAYLGMVFTPDRAEEIYQGLDEHSLQAYRLASLRHLDYLLSIKGC